MVMEGRTSSRAAVLFVTYLICALVLDTAVGQYEGAGAPIRRRLTGQNGASAPYHEAVNAANRAAKSSAKRVSDADPESKGLSHQIAIEDSSVQPLQADASTTIVFTPATAGVLDGGAFSSFLQTNQANTNVAGVKLAPGNYSVLPYSTQGHIYLTCSAKRTSAFKIDLSNTYLTFKVGTIGYIVLDTCTAVTLTGPTTLTYAQAQFPFAQATILTVTDALHYTIQVWSWFLPAWNNIIQKNTEAGTGVLYSGTTREVYQPNRGGADFIVDFTQVTSLGAGVYNVILVRNPYATVYAGDITALAQISDATGIALYGSAKCTVTNINMITAAGFGFYDGIPSAQNSYLSNNLAPSPIPGADGNVQLMTSIHDGFHTTSAAVGPIINNCSFIGAGDDSVAIHGRMYTVAAANAATNTIIAGSGIISSAELNKGDWIWVYDATGRLLGSTYVVSVTSVTAPNGIIPATVDTVFQTTFSGYNYLQLVVTVWPAGFVDLGLGDFVTVPSRSGANFRVTATYFYNGRGCGVVAKASNGTISGNSINKMLYPAIQLGPSFEAKEGAFVSNTTVVNNNINTLSQGILLGSNFMLDLPYAYGNNINNIFNKNQVTNCQISPVTLESALTVDMATNTFTDIMCNVFGGNTRSFGWETQNTPFNMAFVYGITFSGNTIGQTSACTQNFANYAVPTVFINVTHVVGQPLPINPNAPPIYTPPPGALPPPPPPPGGMVIPSVLPGAPPFNIFDKAAVHQEIQNAITQARVDLSLAKPDALG